MTVTLFGVTVIFNKTQTFLKHRKNIDSLYFACTVREHNIDSKRYFEINKTQTFLKIFKNIGTV